MTSPLALGFLGIGLMGRPMTLRLLAAGHPVTVWNRSPDKLAAVIEKGAQAAASPAEVARAADLVMMCLTDTDAVEAVVFGPGGVGEGAGPNTLIVDFSSIRPDATRAIAARLEAATGARWIDAPVSGGVKGAADGTLAIMAGGREADIARARPIVMALAQRLTRMGEVGAGQVAKLCNQVIVSCNLAVIAEAVSLARAGGIDPALLPEALAGGFADSLPLQIFLPRMATGAFDPPLGALATMLKDADSACRLGRESGAALPMTATVAELYRLAAGRGLAGRCVSTLVTLYDTERN